MKKITFLLIAIFMTSWLSFSQTPTTVASFNVAACPDAQSTTVVYDGGVIWVEVVYDGSCTSLTTDTETSDFDTEIGIYDAAGNLIGNNDDGGTGALSSFTADALAAGTYYVAVGGFNTTFNATLFDVTTTSTVVGGSLSMNVSTPGAPPPTPANDNCVDAEALACDDSILASTVSATDSEGNLASDIFYSYTGTVVGDDVTVSLCGSDFDTVITVFDACGGTTVASNDDSCGLQSEVVFTSDGVTNYIIRVEGFGSTSGNVVLNVSCVSTTPPANDECVDAIALDCTNNSASGNTDLSTDGEVWYSFTGTVVDDNVNVSLCGSSFDTILTVYDACDGTVVAVNDDACGLQSELTFLSDGVSTYLIGIVGFNTATGAYDINVACQSALTPNNDDCASAEVINCNDSVTGDTTFASDSDANGSLDVWYSYADTVVGDNVIASLCGSGFDTVITVFDACDGTVVVANDDFCSLQSEVSWVSDGLTTYLIRVEGFNTAAGAYSLEVLCDSQTPPANDDCADATAIGCNDTVNGSTASASNSEGNLAPDVFYSYTGTVAGDDITVSLCGSSFDTVLTVFDACGGNEVATNDDSCGLQSELTFTSDGLTTYIIRVEGFGANSGDYTLAVACVSEPPSCVPATFTVSNDSNNCPADDFTIAVDIMSLGSPATSVNILVDGVLAVTGVDSSASPYLIGGLSGTTDYDITVEDAADNTCFETQAITTSECPPENDLPDGAISLPVGSTLCENSVLGSNVGATDSGEVVPTCGSATAYQGGDVWFEVTVPVTGELTIETSAADTNTITDTLMEVYSGTGGSLVSIACSDDEGAGLYSLLVLTGLTPGDVLLVRVWEFQNNDKGNFNICAWSPTTLGLDDNTFDGFTYFPNPVKDILTLESPNAIDKIEVFNILGQRIVAIDSANTIQNIDMSSIQAGAYFVKVSIGNQIKTIRVIKE